MRVDEYLNRRKEAATSSKNAEVWARMEELYAKKLWYQLTLLLNDVINDSDFTASENLLELYENFIHDFEHRINPLELVQVVLPIFRSVSDVKVAVKLLESVKTTVKTNNEAVILCLTGLAEVKLSNKDKQNRCQEIPEVRSLLEEAQEQLDRVEGVSPVHGQFYKTSSVYLREIGDYSAYYKEALRYLGCADAAKMTASEKAMQAVCLGLAALLGEDVYNFGELLAHPVLESLRGTGESWLIDLLYAFNSGDLEQYEKLKTHFAQWDDLRKQSELLELKIRLLCLMEIAFARPAKARRISFKEISEKAKVPVDAVELLVMQALSRSLMKGSIDQVDQTATFTWVQPRVLDRKQIQMMSERVGNWCRDVKGIEKLVECQAEEILTRY